MKCQSLFSRENEKNVNLSSAELAQRAGTLIIFKCYQSLFQTENNLMTYADPGQ